jgi:transposase
MSVQGKRYTKEFKFEALKLLKESKKTAVEIAHDLGVSAKSLREWRRQNDIDQGWGPEGALTTEERHELVQLRREVRTLRMERDILKKATAFFARECK